MNLIASIVLMIVSTEKWTKLILLLTLLWFIATPIIKKSTNNSPKKRLIRGCAGFLPLILCIVYAVINIHPATYQYFILRGGLLCLILLMLSVTMWIPDSKIEKKFHILNVIKGLMMCGGAVTYFVVIVLLVQNTYVTDYSKLGWAESFSCMIDTMSESYVSRNYKDIDFEGLKERFVPMVEEAEKNNDKKAFAKVLLEYQYEFYDSHIWFLQNSNILSQAEEELVGNDYGLSMYQLSSGDTIAVMVEENSQAENVGIHNGTVIKEWNGIAVDEAMQNVRCLDYWYQFEVLENEALMKPIFLAGQGGETITVTFIADDGSTKNVQLNSMGNYKERETAVLNHFYSRNRIADDNFSYKMLNDDVGYLRITREHYGDEMYDIWTYVVGKHKKVYDEIDAKLQELSDKGMKFLVIDLRNNGGGYEQIGDAVASLFADRKLTNKTGIERNGNIIPITTFHTFDEGKWKELPVAVLVNDACVSSGDVLTHLLSQCPNVTVMGITSSSNSVQTVGGCCYLSDDMFEVYYPIINSLDENNEILEVTADRQARVGFDLRIPVDYDAAMLIFSDSENDYELDYAVDYLHQHQN